MGSKKPVHPNDHVNMSQSSNDCFRPPCISPARWRWWSSAAGAEAPAQGARQEGEGLGEDHQDRAHAHAGRHARDAGAGVLGLRQADRERHQAHRDDAADADGGGAGRHSRRNRPRLARRLRGEGRRAHREDHQTALHLGSQQVRGAGGPRRHGDDPWRDHHGRHGPASRSRTTSASWAPAPARAWASWRCRRTSRAPRSCRQGETRRSARR